MDDNCAEAMRQLFSAKWNIPKAAKYCSITNTECKEMFRQYCQCNPLTYVDSELK